MPEGLRDLFTVVRCIRLGAALPVAMRFAFSGARQAVEAFDEVVGPLIEATISDAVDRGRIRAALICASVKGSYLISSYSTMAEVPMRHALVVLGGSFARLYDDLIDDVAAEGIEERLDRLLHSGPFAVENDLERLLHALYKAIDMQLQRDRDDLIYLALATLHQYQILSRQQRDPTIPEGTLADITWGKGAWGTVALFALVKPAMAAAELDLIKELGGALQLLDDYVDCELDRRMGVSTTMTRHSAHLSDIGRRLRALRPQCLGLYQQHRVGQFLAVLYVLLATAFLKRRRMLFIRSTVERWAGTGAPILVLLRHGGGVAPRRQ